MGYNCRVNYLMPASDHLQAWIQTQALPAYKTRLAFAGGPHQPQTELQQHCEPHGGVRVPASGEHWVLLRDFAAAAPYQIASSDDNLHWLRRRPQQQHLHETAPAVHRGWRRTAVAGQTTVASVDADAVAAEIGYVISCSSGW
jgi:hypothetical protein